MAKIAKKIQRRQKGKKEYKKLKKYVKGKNYKKNCRCKDIAEDESKE